MAVIGNISFRWAVVVISVNALLSLFLITILMNGGDSLNLEYVKGKFEEVKGSVKNKWESISTPTEVATLESIDRPSLKKLLGMDHYNGTIERVGVNDALTEKELVDLSPARDTWKEADFEPKSRVPLVRPEDSRRVRAALISLVRNEELNVLISTMNQVQDKFNKKFSYPWIFFNDVPFSDEFKEVTTEIAKPAKVIYVQIDGKDWNEPSWINMKKAEDLMEIMEHEDNVQYASKMSYHRMCRWNSGIFFNNPVLKDYDWYWRVEPKTQYFCDIDYDVFAYMEDNDKDYGFNINLYDSPQSVRNLWPTTIDFFNQHPDYVHPNSSRAWLLHQSRPNHNEIAHGYSTCHFWSNFEIGRLDFFRSKEYTEYFNHLDKNGGFFYERWGDAPVHSVALALMTDKSRIHFFRDIGYNHIPFFNCHSSPKCSGCRPGLVAETGDLRRENCLGEWFKVAGDG